MEIHPYTLIQKYDLVKISDFNYFCESNKGEQFRVVAYIQDMNDRKGCLAVNYGDESITKNCTCWQRYKLRNIRTGEVLKNVMFDEMSIIELN